MDHYRIIAQNFQDTIETIAMSVDTLAGGIEQGSQLMVEALLADRKVITCGNGVDAALAQIFTCNLMDRFETDRPALPALTLGCDQTSCSAIARSNGSAELFSRQLQALGQTGDVLFCINSAGQSDSLERAIQAAQERNLGVVVLSHERPATALGTRDVLLQVEPIRQPRRIELYTMVIQGLCELIDHALFGGYNQE